MKLNGKTVLITGSSRGIGKEIAWSFAREGCKVVLNASKSLDELNCCYEEMRGAGYPCIKAAGDVSDYTVCQSIFREMEEKFGPVDILVNNAGISHIGLFTDMQPEEWQTIINCNLNSVFNCTHIALKTMIKKQAGVILIFPLYGVREAPPARRSIPPPRAV